MAWIELEPIALGAAQRLSTYVSELDRYTEPQESVFVEIVKETIEQLPEWRCFHCDETFTVTERDLAAKHFGVEDGEIAKCITDRLANKDQVARELARWYERKERLISILISFCRDNPKHEWEGREQDPCGAHAMLYWLQEETWFSYEFPGSTAEAARLAQELKDAQVDDSPNALETLIQEIEARLFRTDADTGANECALTVWNAVRRYAHLPRITKSDLASYHGECGRYHKRGVCPLEKI